MIGPELCPQFTGFAQPGQATHTSVLTAVHNKLRHPQYASCIKAPVFVPLSVKLHIKSYNDGFAIYAANGCHHSTATPPPPCSIQHTRLSLSGGEPSPVVVNEEKSSGPSEKTVGLPKGNIWNYDRGSN